MRKLVLLAVLVLCAAGQVIAGPVYVGSFQVDQGPPWPTVPLAYTGQEAAALLFGGVASDYWISTNPSIDPTTLTHTAWYSTWGGACGGTYPCGTEYAENYVHNSGGYYQNPGDVSAYVTDWAVGSQYANYVWSAVAVPEPVTCALLGSALLGFGILRRRISR